MIDDMDAARARIEALEAALTRAQHLIDSAEQVAAQMPHSASAQGGGVLARQLRVAVEVTE